MSIFWYWTGEHVKGQDDRGSGNHLPARSPKPINVACEYHYLSLLFIRKPCLVMFVSLNFQTFCSFQTVRTTKFFEAVKGKQESRKIWPTTQVHASLKHKLNISAIFTGILVGLMFVQLRDLCGPSLIFDAITQGRNLSFQTLPAPCSGNME